MGYEGAERGVCIVIGGPLGQWVFGGFGLFCFLELGGLPISIHTQMIFT